ncbi:2765_t:CDS:10 [Funneliformis geosporum]|uniref:2765_t:CDS:1 n=1 Tax=Funneliformis geosporum TaxID=1117311 RepID=A0A9W4WK81_9GLOM|nr:2765_t:CDS:10 [Funneliformis geosporum]
MESQIHTFEYEPAIIEDLRVVVGVDFGTTFSGFAYAYIQDNKTKPNIVVNEEWGNFKNTNKINTVLQYDESYGEVVTWGADALSSEPSRRKRHNNKLPRPVEYFKFYLGDVPENKKPKLPSELKFEKAITDYLHQMEKIEDHWPGIDFYNNIRLVFTVPAEFSENSKTIMRRCIYDAGLIKSIGTLNLQFTTEPEAAAIHCMNRLKELKLTTGATYLVVDCGGGTVDLTVRRLLSDDRLAETTERTGDYCGGTYVDDEFLKFLESRVGKSAMNKLKEKHYGQINYLVHKYFCSVIKIPFTGERSKFKGIELDIQKKCPALMQYVTGSEREQLSDEDEWIIDLDFDTVKSFFDPVINKILRLIDMQLSKCSNCSVMFLVGGFSESKYVQNKVKEKFGNDLIIAIPPSPAAAIVSGACEYGLDMKTVTSRVLKWTYGVQVYAKWETGDPPSRKTSEGRIYKFFLMARKGIEVDVNEEFSESMVPVYPNQTSIMFEFFYTTKYNASYCDEPEMKMLGNFSVDLPDTHLGLKRSVLISLRFASMESTVATAKNVTNDHFVQTHLPNSLFPANVYRCCPSEASTRLAQNKQMWLYIKNMFHDRLANINNHQQQSHADTPSSSNAQKRSIVDLDETPEPCIPTKHKGKDKTICF